jgi:multiple sugar transport system ATP-binding protein
MVYVTHDQVEAMTLADRIVVLKDGHIEQVGTPAELYAAPKSRFVASFIGSPAMNFLPVEVANGAFDLPGGGHLAGASTDRHYTGRADFGIRPEHLSVGTDGPAISGRVALIEPLGADTLINVSVGDHQLVARLPGDACPELGAPIRLAFNPAKAALFRPDGLRL